MSLPPPLLGSGGIPPPLKARKPSLPPGGAKLPPPPLSGSGGGSALAPPPAALSSSSGLPPPLAAGLPSPAPLSPAVGLPPPLTAAASPSIPPPLAAVPGLPPPPLVGTPPPLASAAAAVPPPPLAAASPAATPPPIAAALPAAAALPPPPVVARMTPPRKPSLPPGGVKLPPPPPRAVSTPVGGSSLPIPTFAPTDSDAAPEVSPSVQRKAAVVIQTFFRLYAAKKGYKKLYKERGWTLQAKSERVLTSHVTKSRPTTPNRRRPTRGRRVQSKPQSVPDPERGPAGEGGAGVVVSETAKRALAQSTGQILFDPSSVTLRKTPTRSAEEPTMKRPGTAEVPRRARGMTAGVGTGAGGGRTGRPMSMVLPSGISKQQPSSGGAFPPPPSFGDSADTIPPPTSPGGPVASPAPVPADRKRRKTVGKVINNFLQKRPARDDLVEKGVLQPDEFQELAKQDMVTKNKDGSSLRPMAMKSSTCMNIRCEKKLKKGAKHNCKKCGRAFCKSCMNKKAKIPELKYNKPVPMCDTCFLKQKAQAEADAQARGP